MYQILGTERFLRIVLYINAICAAALGSSLWGLVMFPYMRAVSTSVLAVTTLLAVLGETSIFPWICRLPLVWRWLPDIDGEYDVQVQSNWLIVDGRQADNNRPTKDLLSAKQGRACITARLFSIRMSLATSDGYSASDIVVSAISREPGDPRSILTYVFRSRIPIPEASDSAEHFGAARVAIPREKRPVVLTGEYWTNRNWHNGLNTAGIITFTRR